MSPTPSAQLVQARAHASEATRIALAAFNASIDIFDKLARVRGASADLILECGKRIAQLKVDRQRLEHEARESERLYLKYAGAFAVAASEAR